MLLKFHLFSQCCSRSKSYYLNLKIKQLSQPIMLNKLIHFLKLKKKKKNIIFKPKKFDQQISVFIEFVKMKNKKQKWNSFFSIQNVCLCKKKKKK